MSQLCKEFRAQSSTLSQPNETISFPQISLAEIRREFGATFAIGNKVLNVVFFNCVFYTVSHFGKSPQNGKFPLLSFDRKPTL
jgi:hypothetical protein